MGGVCTCCSWTCRPVWPLFIILATLPCMLCSSESPAAAAAAAAAGKMYPRGNHWAVGHLMGKKSIESVSEAQEANSDYLQLSDTAETTELERYEGLMEALLQQNNHKQRMPQTISRLLRLRGGWREEDRDKYLREMSDLLLLVLKLQEDYS